ncbi:hypothetical protein DPMN_130990 [Dreissena polymorpha]|uniref:Trafficking protein particle complex subunit 13 C-terminal domain-containing protein n=1 Tax=Dreissena polymorpha TaxID=45954 RepID=A0A9D4H639_DREPO|nr:hypothetical protein DPMN_130990 [Dreissena polymorpha]
MDLTMSLQNDLNSGVMWCGLSGRALGLLGASEHLDLDLKLITLHPGLQVSSYTLLFIYYVGICKYLPSKNGVIQKVMEYLSNTEIGILLLFGIVCLYIQNTFVFRSHISELLGRI